MVASRNAEDETGLSFFRGVLIGAALSCLIWGPIALLIYEAFKH